MQIKNFSSDSKGTIKGVGIEDHVILSRWLYNCFVRVSDRVLYTRIKGL